MKLMLEVIFIKGSVFKVGNSWMYQFDVGKDSEGNRIRQSQRFPTKEEAEINLKAAIKSFVEGRENMKRLNLTLEATASGTFRSIFINNHGRLIYLELEGQDNKWIVIDCFYVDRNRGAYGEKRKQSVPLKQKTKEIKRDDESLLLMLSKELDKLFFGVDFVYNEDTLEMDAYQYADFYDSQNERYYFLIFQGLGDIVQDNLSSRLVTRLKNKLHRSIYVDIEYIGDNRGFIRECYYYDKAFINKGRKVIPPRLHSVYVEYTRESIINLFVNELDCFFTDIIVVLDGSLNLIDNLTPACGAL